MGREGTVAGTRSWRLWEAEGQEGRRAGLLSLQAALWAASSPFSLRPAPLLDGVFPLLPLHGDLTLPW